jgi:hypothetical protein
VAEAVKSKAAPVFPCSHCKMALVFPVAWCPHCLDHHHKNEMHLSGWCKRCQAGLNEEYLAKVKVRRPFVPAPPETWGPSTVVDAFAAWIKSPEYAAWLASVRVARG